MTHAFQSRHAWALVIVLIGATLAVFHPVFQAEFVPWDDDLNIFANTHIQALDGENLRWMFTDTAYARRYMPLGWLGWAIQYQFCGLNAVPYHVVNVLFHAANAALLFLLIRRLLLVNRPHDLGLQSRADWAAFLGALLWSIHPLRVEAVAWASSRLYNQAFFFALTSLVLYLRSLACPEPTKRRLWLFGSVLCFALSLLTYPITLSMVIIPFLLDIYPLRRIRAGIAFWSAPNRQVLLEKLPFVFVCLCVFAVTLWARLRADDYFGAPPTLSEFPLGSRIMQSFYIWAYYLWKPLFPFHLSPIYDTLILFNPTDLKFVASLCLVVGLTVAAVLLRRRCPAFTCAWFCYLLLLVPLLGITERPHYASDRYSYIVTIVSSAMVAGGFFAIPRTVARLLTAGVLLIACGMLSLLAIRQCRIWETGDTLFQHALAEAGETPLGGFVHLRLASILTKQNRTDEALTELEAAIRLHPHNPRAHANYGLLLAQKARPREAIAHYRHALEIKPDIPETLNNLAWLLAAHPEAEFRNGLEAVSLAERAVQLSRRSEPAFIGTLAAAYAETGRFVEAVSTAEQALTLAQELGRADLAARNRQLLELYRAGKTAREAP